MKSLKVLSGVLLAATIVLVTFDVQPAFAQQVADSKDKKKQSQDSPPAPKRGASSSDFGAIGANPRRTGEVPARCENAYALAAQIMAGGPTDRMVYGRNTGNMDASQAHVAPPLQARMEPRQKIRTDRGDVWIHPGRAQGELNNAERGMAMPGQNQRMHGC